MTVWTDNVRPMTAAQLAELQGFFGSPPCASHALQVESEVITDPDDTRGLDAKPARRPA